MNNPSFPSNENFQQKNELIENSDQFPYRETISIFSSFSSFTQEELNNKLVNLKICGRILKIRIFGKYLTFADLNDSKGVIQLKIVRNEDFSHSIKVGDIVEIIGNVCKTDKGELSINVQNFRLLKACSKSFPDFTYYGISDENRFTLRYLDLIAAEKKEIFFFRHKLIKKIRSFFDSRDFIELETPMLVNSASGAQAKPFITYHNSLGKNFYLRIAPEIYLKKALIAGFEKVYEIARVLRNEGIDLSHNPEFTIAEFYQAYANALTMMNLTEELIKCIVSDLLPGKTFSHENQDFTLSERFERYSMIESLEKFADLKVGWDFPLQEMIKLAEDNGLKLEEFQKNVGIIILSLFENFVEKKLIRPTFIYDFPLEASPLAKEKIPNSKIADRFELYIKGKEIANGYSELNDSSEQRKRFLNQLEQKKMGNKEIADADADFVEALEYGMPPAGGLGIGIDRLTMILMEKNSIRDVILFPQTRKISFS